MPAALNVAESVLATPSTFTPAKSNFIGRATSAAALTRPGVEPFVQHFVTVRPSESSVKLGCFRMSQPQPRLEDALPENRELDSLSIGATERQEEARKKIRRAPYS
jgi:hypothetical protein